MIARIEGTLESIEEGFALVRPSGQGLTYQVLVPAYAGARLGGLIGQTVVLCTLSFIESQAQGATMTPRLAGFMTVQERRFFELFTTCKGIGNRKALRAMALDVARLAGAIADRDVATLQTLPEIGRRTAETIVATLHGKVDPFLAAAGTTVAGDDDAGSTDMGAGLAGGIVREAIDVLLQLGENRNQAIEWIDQALRGAEGRPDDVQDLIEAVYRIKAQR